MKWGPIRKATRSGGRYNNYLDKVCLLIVETKTKKNVYAVISPPTWVLLGKPDRLLFLQGENGVVGLRGLGKIDKERDPDTYAEGYAFTGGWGKKGETNSMRFVHAKQFVKLCDLPVNVVNEQLYVEDNIVVANKDKFKPAKFRT
jgi:hypothetical protein